MIKRITWLMVLIAALLIIIASASGEGDGTWSFDYSSGVLTISGNGPIPDYSNGLWGPSNPPPWNSLQKLIRKVVIENGVTRIGNEAFHDIYSQYDLLEEVEIAGTVESIGE